MGTALSFEIYFNFNRKIASLITPILYKTPLKPNHITTLSLLAGFISAYFMSLGSRVAMLGGALFLQISFILDNCDGDIARMKSLQSVSGMWYDLTADLGVDFLQWIGLALGAVRQGVTPLIFIVCFTACAGSLINFFRVVFMRVAQGRSGKESALGLGPLSSAIHVLSHDGDPTLFVWFMSLVGYPGYLLFFGAVYINVIWIYSLILFRNQS